MTDLRKLARGMDCTVRIPGVCNFNPETTVLAHVRQVGISGMGRKAPDLLAAYACSACHEYCDTHRDAQTELDFLRGVMRTQYLLIEGALVRW